MGLINLITGSKWTENVSQSFWEHLDALRAVIFKSLIITVIVATVVFCFKETLFAIVLAPHSSEFFLFRWLNEEPFSLQLINVDLTEQFMMHMKTAIYVGLLLASPYILYALFGFLAPALYKGERRVTALIITSAYLMFVLGTALNYCLIFPLTVRFMGTYSVGPEVTNMLSLRSYVNTLLTMNLLMGLMFELPVVCWILGRMGLISSKFMSKYRRHAIVIIFTAAMIITPTTDIFSLVVVSVPIWMLYELSILLVALTGKKRRKEDSEDEADESDSDAQAKESGSKADADKESEQSDADNHNGSETSDENDGSEKPDDSGSSDEPDGSDSSDESEQAEAEETKVPAPAPNSDLDLDWESQRLREWGYDN